MNGPPKDLANGKRGHFWTGNGQPELFQLMASNQLDSRGRADQALGSTRPFACLIIQAFEMIDNLIQILVLTGIRRELAIDTIV